MGTFADAHVAGSVNARVGYGLALRAGRVLAPFGELGMRGDDNRFLRMGLRWTDATQAAAPLHVELVGGRRDTRWGRVDYRLGLAGTLKF